MKSVESEAPEHSIETIEQYIAKVREVSGPIGSGIVFRGQENAGWSLASSGARRMCPGNESDVSMEEFQKHHLDLISDAKEMRHHLRGHHALTDLELLADMRHHGAATALIDFTRSSLVALWFACAVCRNMEQNAGETVEQDGMVFCLNTASFLVRDVSSAITDTAEKGDKKDFLGLLEQVRAGEDAPRRGPTSHYAKPDPVLYVWSPPTVNPRILSQRSMFIFGPPVIPQTSQGRPVPLSRIRIPATAKAKIRHELRVYHGITKDTLFPDFEGYATNRGTTHVLRPEDALLTGIEQKARGEYARALENMDTALELEDKSATGPSIGRNNILFHIAQVHIWNEDPQKAVSVYTEIIEDKGLAPGAKAQMLSWRAQAYSEWSRKERSEAYSARMARARAQGLKGEDLAAALSRLSKKEIELNRKGYSDYLAVVKIPEADIRTRYGALNNLTLSAQAFEYANALAEDWDAIFASGSFICLGGYMYRVIYLLAAGGHLNKAKELFERAKLLPVKAFPHSQTEMSWAGLAKPKTDGLSDEIQGFLEEVETWRKSLYDENGGLIEKPKEEQA